MNTKTIPYHKALEAPARLNGMKLIGFVWRENAATIRWIFRENLAGRSYTVTAQFIPVYSALED